VQKGAVDGMVLILTSDGGDIQRRFHFWYSMADEKNVSAPWGVLPCNRRGATLLGPFMKEVPI
jgi:hypothetical protein